MDRALRIQVRVALDIHKEGRQAAALECATLLAGANPRSALALNLLGYLHVLAGGAALDERAAVDDETSSHFRAAHDAFSAAAGNAPNCVLTTVALARALAAEDRYAEAQRELLRVIAMAPSDQADPAVNNVGYKDDVDDEDSSPNERKDQALRKACDLVQEVSAVINKEIVPGEAGKLLGVGGGDAHLLQGRESARNLSVTYPHSAGARLLRVCIELERVREPDAALDTRRLHLHSSLNLISDAAGIFDSSHLVALFHAKILFALDKFDESENECRRALRIETPSDPNLDDIPPFVSVPGADYDSRVSAVKKQIRILLKRVIVVAGVCWSSIRNTIPADRVTSFRVDTLQEHYKEIDKPAADVISDTVRFFNKHGSWSFLVCPNSGCHRKKLPDPQSLWKHIRSKHRDDLLKKLQSVLGELLNDNTAMDDHSFDGMMTLTEESKQHIGIFHLPRLQPMFESLLLPPSVGIQAEPLAEMRQRKCTQGAVVFDDIRKKLRMLPKNEASIQFQELSFEIQSLWLNFLEASALDPREVILPLARSFQWVEMKKSIALSLKDLSGIIRSANIDSIFGTSGQSVKEMASTSSAQQSLIVSNKNNADKGMSILSIAIRSLCNLRHFRDRFLTQPLVWTPSADNIDRSEKANYSYNNDGEEGNVLPLKSVPPIIPHDASVGNAQNDHSHPRLVPLEGCSSNDSEAVQFHREQIIGRSVKRFGSSKFEVHRRPFSTQVNPLVCNEPSADNTIGVCLDDPLDKFLESYNRAIGGICGLCDDYGMHLDISAHNDHFPEIITTPRSGFFWLKLTSGEKCIYYPVLLENLYCFGWTGGKGGSFVVKGKADTCGYNLLPNATELSFKENHQATIGDIPLGLLPIRSAFDDSHGFSGHNHKVAKRILSIIIANFLEAARLRRVSRKVVKASRESQIHLLDDSDDEETEKSSAWVSDYGKKCEAAMIDISTVVLKGKGRLHPATIASLSEIRIFLRSAYRKGVFADSPLPARPLLPVVNTHVSMSAFDKWVPILDTRQQRKPATKLVAASPSDAFPPRRRISTFAFFFTGSLPGERVLHQQLGNQRSTFFTFERPNMLTDPTTLSARMLQDRGFQARRNHIQVRRNSPFCAARTAVRICRILRFAR